MSTTFMEKFNVRYIKIHVANFAELRTHRHTDVGIELIGSIKLIKDISKVRYQTFQN